MRFQSRIYLRLGAMTGSMIGILAMIVAVSAGCAKLGAGLLVVCAGIGSTIGYKIEKRRG